MGRFAAERHADLWAGVGLAATFAGCSTPGDLAALRAASGAFGDHLGQGCVFAAKARHHSGTVPEHTRVAAHALTGLSVEAAAQLADDTHVPSGGGDGPAYELWRRSVRDRLPARAAV